MALYSAVASKLFDSLRRNRGQRLELFITRCEKPSGNLVLCEEPRLEDEVERGLGTTTLSVANKYVGQTHDFSTENLLKI